MLAHLPPSSVLRRGGGALGVRVVVGFGGGGGGRVMAWAVTLPVTIAIAAGLFYILA